MRSRSRFGPAAAMLALVASGAVSWAGEPATKAQVEQLQRPSAEMQKEAEALPERCAADKISATADYLRCRLQAHAAAIRSERPFDDSRCDDQLAMRFRLAERRFGDACPTTDDVADLRTRLAPTTDVLALQLSGVRYVDNGDGTVTDLQAGLMWEKKDDLGGIHDVDDVYLWSATGSAPDGTAFTVFLATLNHSTSEDGSGASGCFAGHCDWRLPTVDELKTILLEPVVPCGTHPCIDPIFGPTANAYYWSATEAAPFVDWAWAVLFYDGHVSNLLKTEDASSVRAVRTAF